MFNRLEHIDPKFLWECYTTSEFATLMRDKPFLAILPCVTYGEKENQPLNAQEVAITKTLGLILKKEPINALVLPPFIFSQNGAFAMKWEDIYDAVRELAEYVKAAGIQKLALLNTSSLNNNIVDLLREDITIEQKLPTFSVHMDAVGDALASVLKEISEFHYGKEGLAHE